MAVFQAALVNEIEKLYKKKKALVAVILTLAIIVIGQLVIVGVRSGFGVRGVGSVEFSMLVLSVVINTILPLFTALIVIDSFSGEFAANSMRITLTRPVSRFKLFSAKLTAVAVFILTALMLLLIFSLLAGFLFNANSASLGDVARIVVAYLMSLLPLFVLALGIALAANILRSGISVFFLAVLGFIVFQGLGMFFTRYSGLLITTELSWYNLWLASTLPLGKIIREFLIMVGYAIILFTAGFYLFDKKEF
ncbi:MAG: ABC transporter permease subunit [Peptococcaceae bacterium]|nr:ABC transporter permease subunit [Peptococcaceae bacterium]